MAEKKWGKTTCSVCKKEKSANPDALAARLKKYGSLEAIAKSWVCRDCANEAKGLEPKPKKEKVKKEKVVKSKSQAKRTAIQEEKDFTPYTKERQLNKKVKKAAKEAPARDKATEDEDYLAK